MTATVEIIETNLAENDYGVISNFNFGSSNSRNLDPSLFPLVAGTYSFEKWIHLAFGGTFTQINNLKIFLDIGQLIAGEEIKINSLPILLTAFQIPVNEQSQIADTMLPASEPVSPNISIGGSFTGIITPVYGSSDFIVLQKYVGPAARFGMTNELTITVSYDEVP